MKPLYYYNIIDHSNFNGSYYYRCNDMMGVVYEIGKVIDILMLTGDKMLAVGKLKELQKEIKERGN